MKLTLTRDQCTADSTLGKLYVNDVYQCETLEDADRSMEAGGTKIPGCTAIPRGTYEVLIDWSLHFKRTLPRLLDVPGFEGIRIHPGNAPADTEGCILVGLRRGPNYIYQSVNAFNLLFARIEEAIDAGDKVTITVE